MHICPGFPWRCAAVIAACHAFQRTHVMNRRSASLMKITRRSRDIASMSLRKLSASASTRVRNFILSSLVTPSTSSAISGPNCRVISCLVQWCVFYRVVQYRGRDTFMIHAHIGEDLRHGNRVQDVRLTGFPGLPFMSSARRPRRPAGLPRLFPDRDKYSAGP